LLFVTLISSLSACFTQGPELYQAAASATAAATLLGFLLAAEVGQLALAGGASVTSLFYASLVTVVRVRNAKDE
jgi:hypothetical protein